MTSAGSVDVFPPIFPEFRLPIFDDRDAVSSTTKPCALTTHHNSSHLKLIIELPVVSQDKTTINELIQKQHNNGFTISVHARIQSSDCHKIGFNSMDHRGHSSIFFDDFPKIRERSPALSPLFFRRGPFQGHYFIIFMIIHKMNRLLLSRNFLSF